MLGSWIDPPLLPHQPSTSRTQETLVNAALRLGDGLIQDLVAPGRAPLLEPVPVRYPRRAEIRPPFFRTP